MIGDKRRGNIVGCGRCPMPAIEFRQRSFNMSSEGEVLDILVQSRRNKKAALDPMRKLLKKQGYAPIPR